MALKDELRNAQLKGGNAPMLTAIVCIDEALGTFADGLDGNIRKYLADVADGAPAGSAEFSVTLDASRMSVPAIDSPRRPDIGDLSLAMQLLEVQPSVRRLRDYCAAPAHDTQFTIDMYHRQDEGGFDHGARVTATVRLTERFRESAIRVYDTNGKHLLQKMKIDVPPFL